MSYKSVKSWLLSKYFNVIERLEYKKVWPKNFWSHLVKKEITRQWEAGVAASRADFKKLVHDDGVLKVKDGQVVVNLHQALQQLMRDEGPGMKQYDGQSEYDYFRGWSDKWSKMKDSTGQGPF